MALVELEGRRALVTGSSRGIGAGIAIELARAGADVAVNYLNSREGAEAVAETIRGLRRRAIVVQADVTDAEACRRLVEQATSALGNIDILVNNAGVVAEWKPVIETEATEMQRLFASHVLSSLHLSKLLLPSMREARRADIIMISSILAQTALPRWSTYTVAKAGMEALAATLAKEERQYGVRVNVVAPGWVASDMMSAGFQELFGVSDPAKLAQRFPFGEIATPEDIGRTVVFLCSPGGRYITNERLTVSGGMEDDANYLKKARRRGTQDKSNA